MGVDKVRKRLREAADPQKAAFFPSFFKTGKGEYGEGDIFIGVTVPVLRKLVKEFRHLDYAEIRQLLQSKIHEERLLSLLALVDRFGKSDEPERKKIFGFYMKNLAHVNNWDLVDSSAPYIVGGYLEERDRSILYKLAKSKRLWDRRVAVVATFKFIRNGDFGDTLAISGILLDDGEDLMHKAAGWMLREVYKRDAAIAENFIARFMERMPRTMLRYAIERFPEAKRKAFLKRPKK